jgi:choloylglycine hydrolase
MCTAVSNKRKYHLFGRTLDVERDYGQAAVVTPRKIAFDFIYGGRISEHPALVGAAIVKGGVPLYFDAMNEHGLAIAALNFPRSAVYREHRSGKSNLASFELIPWVLCSCRCVEDAAELLADVNVTQDSFDGDLRATPMHWMISDRDRSIVAEPLESGLMIYENSVGVLTNEPRFDEQLRMLDSDLSAAKSFGRGVTERFSGDFSSRSRFVRAAVINRKAYADGSPNGEISRFFRVMDSVSSPCGCAVSEDGREIFTHYTSCVDTGERVYYFSTHTNRRIRAVRLDESACCADRLLIYSMHGDGDIDFMQHNE